MKKPGVPILLIITVTVLAFTIGYFLGSSRHQPAVLSIPDAMHTLPAETVPQALSPSESSNGNHSPLFPININTATKQEFMELPGIGEILADRIIAYRDSIGTFSTVEGLMNVEGIGEKRIEELIDLITIGG